MLPKSPIIFAIVFAAAVLVPLRKARGAFGPHSALPGLTSAPRVSMRRRPSRPRPDSRTEPGVLLRDFATCAAAQGTAVSTTVRTASGKPQAAGRVRLARRFRGAHSTHSTPPHSTLKRPSSVSQDSGRTHGHHDGDRILDRVGCPSRHDQVSTPSPAPRSVAAQQAVGDIPDPPPKHRA
jgi:hypothetical protein